MRKTILNINMMTYVSKTVIETAELNIKALAKQNKGFTYTDCLRKDGNRLGKKKQMYYYMLAQCDTSSGLKDELIHDDIIDNLRYYGYTNEPLKDLKGRVAI